MNKFVSYDVCLKDLLVIFIADSTDTTVVLREYIDLMKTDLFIEVVS